MGASDNMIWIQVRLRREVHERLTAYADYLDKAAPAARGDLGNGHGGRVSLGDAVERLLDMREAHLQRSRKKARVSGRREPRGK